LMRYSDIICADVKGFSGPSVLCDFVGCYGLFPNMGSIL